jgi:23S rRNA U2552 (ribose-2'-O)-methylase RlmE/FtsJ
MNIQDSSQDKNVSPTISNSLSYYLNDIKKQICVYEKDWDIYKKYTNPYEYIHTNIPNKKYCISKYKPLSRAYFKMIELINSFNLGIDSPHPIRSFHLAEGPGGFIEAVAKSRMCSKDSYIGMTLLDNTHDSTIPGWNKTESFLREFTNVKIENGIDGTGNILSFNNFVYINETYGSSMDLITADGGFDFSDDFDNQELNMVSLLYGQIIYALCMQKHGGCFVLKVFDIFMQQTIDIIALLSSMYQQVYITKPYTSRYANSEKYIVCKGFIHKSSSLFYPYLYNSFQDLCNHINNNNKNYIKSILKHGNNSNIFTSKLEEYNIIFGQQQIENIHITLMLLLSSKEDETKYSHFGHNNFNSNRYNNSHLHTNTNIRKTIKMNIQKCIQWCVKHKIGYNYDV